MYSGSYNGFKGLAGYVINHAEKKIVCTKNFLKCAEKEGSPASVRLGALKKLHPNHEIVQRV